jgi:hypothetical protein
MGNNFVQVAPNSAAHGDDLSVVSRRPSKREGDRENTCPHPSVPVAQVLETYAENRNQ